MWDGEWKVERKGLVECGRMAMTDERQMPSGRYKNLFAGFRFAPKRNLFFFLFSRRKRAEKRFAENETQRLNSLRQQQRYEHVMSCYYLLTSNTCLLNGDWWVFKLFRLNLNH